MALQLLTFTDLKFPEGREPWIRAIHWGTTGASFRITILTREGMETHELTTSSNRSLQAEEWRLPNLPMMVSAYPVPGTVRRGELYTSIFLRFAAGPLWGLLADYLISGKALTWPPGEFKSSVEGPGRLSSITGADPAVGAEIFETVPTNARWLLKALYFSLVTDATVADRQVRLIIDDGTNILDTYIMASTQAASLTRYYVFTHFFATETLTGSYVMTGLTRPIDLFQGWRIRTATINLKAGDNFGAPQLLVEEWIEE